MSSAFAFRVPPAERLVARMISTVALAIIVWWTVDVEKKACKCTAGWKRDLIRYGFSVAGVLSLLLTFLRTDFMTPNVLLGMLVIMLYIVTLSYVDDLRRTRCACAGGWKRDFALVWPAISLGMLVLAMLAGFVLTDVAMTRRSDYAFADRVVIVKTGAPPFGRGAKGSRGSKGRARPTARKN
jgi:hypothetical protein